MFTNGVRDSIDLSKESSLAYSASGLGFVGVTLMCKPGLSFNACILVENLSVGTSGLGAVGEGDRGSSRTSGTVPGIL